MVADGRSNDLGRVELIIDQLIGQVVVNESRLIYSVRLCKELPTIPTVPTQDRITLNSNTGGDSAVILLDARRPQGCVNDEVQRTDRTAFVSNVLSNGSCNSEVAVFSDDNAMTIESPVRVWTDPLGDLLKINTGPILQVPTTVWVMRGNFAATQTRVQADFARANALYNTMNCGISFSEPVINNATGDPDTAGLINAACPSGSDLRTRIGFTNGRLNIYYLNDPAGSRGWWCGNNTIIIGSSADNETLTHEIGHAFSLGHTNGIPGIGGNNIMITGGTGRNFFTIGQCFRCNVNNNSTLNTNRVRIGLTRACPDGTTSPICPQLAFDVTPR